MSVRFVIQGADRAPALPTCRGCHRPIQGGARLLPTGGLTHKGPCYDYALRGRGECTVCETPGFEPWELDASGRCDPCRP